MGRLLSWILLAALGLSGCHAPTKSTLVLSNEVEPFDSVSPVDRRIEWLPLVDARPADARSVGQIGRDTYEANRVDHWISDALHRLTKPALPVTAPEGAPADLSIRPTLVRFYLQNVDITKSAHVVLKLEFFPSAEPAFTKLYRGRYTAINWWGTDLEMSRALNLALQDCLKQIVADLAPDARPNGTAPAGGAVAPGGGES